MKQKRTKHTTIYTMIEVMELLTLHFLKMRFIIEETLCKIFPPKFAMNPFFFSFPYILHKLLKYECFVIKLRCAI